VTDRPEAKADGALASARRLARSRRADDAGRRICSATGAVGLATALYLGFVLSYAVHDGLTLTGLLDTWGLPTGLALGAPLGICVASLLLCWAGSGLRAYAGKQWKLEWDRLSDVDSCDVGEWYVARTNSGQRLFFLFDYIKGDCALSSDLGSPLTNALRDASYAKGNKISQREVETYFEKQLCDLRRFLESPQSDSPRRVDYVVAVPSSSKIKSKRCIDRIAQDMNAEADPDQVPRFVRLLSAVPVHRGGHGARLPRAQSMRLDRADCVAGSCILLIDDMSGTTQTLCAVADSLLAAGAAHVDCAVLSRNVLLAKYDRSSEGARDRAANASRLYRDAGDQHVIESIGVLVRRAKDKTDRPSGTER